MLSNPFDFRSNYREVEQLRREMNQLFEQLDRGPRLSAATTYPAMNVWTNADGAVITAELPGMNADDLEISVQGDTLTLRGSRSAEEQGEGMTYHRRERGSGQFRRSFQLPFNVDPNKVEANYERGVLHIFLPRSEADKPRKIQVRSA
jgi:HSP20 family protein